MQQKPRRFSIAYMAAIRQMNDVDICPLCNLPIEPGQPWHTRARAHYDCFADTEDGKRELRLFAMIRDGRQSIRDREAREAAADESIEQARTGRGETYLARAAGGHLVHLVDAGTGVSLCGHKPVNNARNMRPRARWYPQGNETPFFRRPCDKCKQFGEIPWQPRPDGEVSPGGGSSCASDE